MTEHKSKKTPDGCTPSAALPEPDGSLREVQLAARWQVSRRTLQRWRQQASGPAWIQINGVILYRESDIRAFEDHRRVGHAR